MQNAQAVQMLWSDTQRAGRDVIASNEGTISNQTPRARMINR